MPGFCLITSWYIDWLARVPLPQVRDGTSPCRLHSPDFSYPSLSHRGTLTVAMPRNGGFLASFLIWAVAACAQTVCPPPPAIQPISPLRNIFTDAQESDLGDAMAESSIRELQEVDNEVLSAHLVEVAGQLLPYLPPNQFRFRFSLMDFPEMNAFSFAGGRVFVSRKLVAFARSDDEIAGVLAHELGHIITHQSAIKMTRRMRDVLGITQVGNRADIFDKYQRLLESWRRKPGPREKEEEDQYVADQVALYVMMRAGFKPQAFIEFWDRFNEVHGKTGNWLSDFFGTTKPEQKRLREMLRSLSAMPPGCSSTPPVALTGDFQKWQSEVVGYRATAAGESLPGLVFRQTLALPLRPDITNLRFSPDGNLVLAQDDGGIHVLKRDPLSLLFFIDAPDANKAFFSPDSRSVVFYTPSLRVEVWDVAKQKRTSVHEMVLREPCLQDLLSPDGRTLACLDAKFTFLLIDVSTGDTLLTKKEYFRPDFMSLFWMLTLLLREDETTTLPRFSFVNMAFSPDAHYFLCGMSPNGNLGYDLAAHREMALPGSLKEATHAHFAFVGNERLASTNVSSPKKSAIYRFPSGEKAGEYLGGTSVDLAPVTRGDYLVVSPLKDAPIGIFNLDTNQLSSLSHPAADIYDGLLLYERDNGELALGDIKAMKGKAAFRLVQSRLGTLRTVAVSPDFNWLALSTRNRGALWDLSHNIRIQLFHGFTGSGFDRNNSLIADFPKGGDRKRSMLQIDVMGNGRVLREIKQELSYQQGVFLVERTPASDKSSERKNWNVEVRDAATDAPIWSRRFPKEVPRLALDPVASTVLLEWPVDTVAAREELRQFPELKSRSENDDYLLEFVDLRTNALLGKLLVKTNKGSVRIRDFAAAGDWAAIEVRGDRVLTYSFRSGSEVGHVFGTDPLLSTATNQFAVTTPNGEVETYSLTTTTLLRHYRFPIPVAFKQFSSDGKRLFVLTRDQTAYVLDLADLR
jgi:WD40 repeat protein